MEWDIRHGRHQPPWILPTIRHTLFWILAVHVRLDQKRQSKRFQKHALYYGITTEFCRCNKSLSCLPNLRRRPVGKVVLSIFRQHLCVQPEWTFLRTGDVPVLFSLPEMKNLEMTIELDPKGDKITCPAFGMYSYPDEYSTVGHIVLDLTSLAYQAEIAWAICSPEETCNFCTIGAKNQHIQLTQQNWMKTKMINLLFVRTALPFLKMKVINLWRNLHQIKNWWQESVNLPQNAVFLHHYKEDKDLQPGETPSATLEKDV